jgi:HlyD family secretion protein
MKRRIFIFILLLAAIGAGLYYYYQLHTAAPITLTGMVTTDDVIVSAQVQGRLQELKVKQGDIVKKGDLVALIQPEQWKADMSFYQSSQQQAESQLVQAEADLRFQESQTKNQISQAEASQSAAQAQVALAQADLENAALMFKREDEAYKKGAESAQSYDQARTSFEGFKARLDAAKKQALAADATVALAKSNLEQVEVRRAAVESSRHQAAAAAAQQEKAKVELGYTEIHAPIDGIVDVRAALQGEVVNPGQAIVTLINQDDLWVRADVEETYIDRIHIGDQFDVRLPSGRILPGTVFYRAVDADFATQRDVSRTKRDIRTFEIRIRCDNKDRALAVGMTAYVLLPLTGEK